MQPELTRRRFLGLVGAGSAGVGGLAVLSACGSSGKTAAANQAATPTTAVAATAAATAPSMESMPGMDHGSAAPAAQTSPDMTPDQMDQADQDKIQQFLQNTKSPITRGKGGIPLAYEMDGDTKVFTLTTSKVEWETTPGQTQTVYSYNGMLPGPEIRVTEGDKVRVVLRNGLPESTTIHFHGLHGIPNAMDGVGNLTQPPVKPGRTFTYEFVARPAGTHMYHSHINAMKQVGSGLLGAFIVEPKDKSTYPHYDKEYVMVLNDTLLGFTINGKGFPATEALTAKQGERLLIRFMNEGNMNHPMHLHGMPMWVYAVDGYPLPNPYYCDTLDVAPGNRYEVFVDATDAGAWAFHCHILTHAEGDSGMFGLVTALVVT
jgi:FtsP/CotA-like multicopper oxidase with cupredoxin domain